MCIEFPLAISISRQLGSGGSVLGKNLAKELNFVFLDREIVRAAADRLGIHGEELEDNEEKINSVWKSFLLNFQYTDLFYAPVPIPIVPNDREIYEVEADIILRAAKEKPVVIVGRGASHILKDHPNHVSIFLHAKTAFRQKRSQEIYNISESKASKLIYETDITRQRHLHKFTGQDMYDLRNYNLTIDTSIVGLDIAEKIIMHYIQLRFGDKIRDYK
ncbi:cytidylate kinase-like family protein [Desulfosporosinus sp. Sb-LF]|uniref:cytidylate kinase-like family protein n=1 Tax=Desulfosporosinus sp. Sb-LF TaxID=2560027 RepID=UPI00107F41E0|nr:cytidylate kinase-like family protein [Desulfosporosinus sp. Sb-LF]TGE32977.1 cytidylate kinase-like family protein [Desulfosporosinus sp. Sb-LF]